MKIDFTLRTKTSFKRPPKRTSKELAEEFGITQEKLSALIRWNNGPKPFNKYVSMSVGSRTYYDPIEMRKWYKGLNI